MSSEVVVLERHQFREEVARGVAEALSKILDEDRQKIDQFNEKSYLLKEWWTPAEAGRYLGVTGRTVRDYAYDGKIPYSKPFNQRQMYLRREDVIEALEGGRIDEEDTTA